MKTLIPLFLFAGCILLPAQKLEDTLTQGKAKFPSLGGIPMISPKGNWIAINKQYKLGGDTAYVISTKNKTAHKILSSGMVEFLKEEGAFGRKANIVQFVNLKTNKSYQYDNISNYYRLDSLNRFALHTKDKKLRFYDLKGNQLHEIDDIDDPLITDNKSRLYLIKQQKEKSEIIVSSGAYQERVYSTLNRIIKYELTPSGKQLIIIETASEKENNQLTILDTKNAYKKVAQFDIPNISEINLTEIQDGRFFLISARVRFSEAKSSLVEVWYGNDPFVNIHNRMFVDNKYWLLETKKNKITAIKVPRNQELASINNPRYFLSYLPRKGYNFNTMSPNYNDADILDISTGNSEKLGNLIQVQTLIKGWRPDFLGDRVFCSKDGKWFLASNDGKRWSLFSHSGKRETLIEQYGLEKPVFSENGNQIYFESSDDLWKYDIKTKKLASLGIAKGKAVQIKNDINKRNDATMVSFLPEDSILLEVYDNYTNIISYHLYQAGKWKQVVPETKNRIDPHHLLFNKDMKTFYTLERNFNLPPTLYSYVQGQKKVLFDAGIKDTEVKKVKQEIYNFNAVGKNLKGILYYPINYDLKKKYPMVVHIYEVQRALSNDYLSPNNISPIGFQIRILLERGYFVYLPDIEHGKDGPGMSALECVNGALDAVLKNPIIDHNRIALAGQSYGGYETNFIATRSDRFTTYISGAGNSDLIRNYYTYSYQFNMPYYFQFENGQYQLGTSVAEDKERYINNSPILNVENVNASILLWAGKKDENVQWDQVMEFYVGLRRYQKQVIALFYPNGNHDFLHHPLEENDRDKRILEWFDYFLKDKKDIPWINKQLKKDTQ